MNKLPSVVARAAGKFRPPERLTVSEWADKYRILPRDTNAEAGRWRTSRTPYLKEIMDSFSDPKIRRIVLVSASQAGKSEAENNMIGYTIAQDLGGAILFIHPNLDDARRFSRQRIAPMIRDCPQLKAVVSDVKSRDSGNTILQKAYPGGTLTLIGSQSPSALASLPARFVICDERDRWAASAGTEGDPFLLAQARTKTFYNAKIVEVSTPTIKGASNIARSFELGTREYWMRKCPHCGEFHNIRFADIRFEHSAETRGDTTTYKVWDVRYVCPDCGALSDERTMRKQEAKWVAESPEAYDEGIRSFWLNAFSSPWQSWDDIIKQFLRTKDDPEQLQVTFNTLFGELWEDRGELSDEDSLLARREQYEAELPKGVLCLTVGVDTQDNRLEYEVVGHGMFGETWGIKKGFIMGVPSTEEVWTQLESALVRDFHFADGSALRPEMIFVDRGGHFTAYVDLQCQRRRDLHFFPIYGVTGDNKPYTTYPKLHPLDLDPRFKVWRYSLGVDAGKVLIMQALRVQTPGPKFWHFPMNPEAGYDYTYFNGLLSEKLTLVQGSSGNKWQWKPIPGHPRNEPLDCRNYAMAAFSALSPNMEERERGHMPSVKAAPQTSRRKSRTVRHESGSDW